MNETTPSADDFNHAQSRLRKEDFSGAETFCTQAIDAGLNTADVYYVRGKARHFAGNRVGAVEDYSHAIERDSNHAMAYERRSDARRELGDSAGCQADSLSAVLTYPVYHQKVLAPPSGYLPVSHRIPTECWTLRYRSLEFYEARISEAQHARDLAGQLAAWLAFQAIGGTIDSSRNDVEDVIQKLRAKLNGSPE